MNEQGSDRPNGSGNDWIGPATDVAPVARYGQMLAERVWLIVAVVAVAVGAAVAYIALTPKTYEAKAGLLVTPVPASESALGGLSLIQETANPSEAVQTAALLVTTTAIAGRVKQRLGLSGSPRGVLKKISTTPVAGSNIIAVVAKQGSAIEAQRLANTFTAEAVAERTERLHSEATALLTGLRPQASTGGAVVRADIGRLEAIEAGPDPTLKIAMTAPVPVKPASPRPVLSLVAALLAGLVIGIGGAFTWQSIDPRLRREDQLRRLFRLPILARIPEETKKAAIRRALPDRLSPATLEAYRSLRTTLMAFGRQPDPTSILVTGSSPSEGKSTTAINLAHALMLTGARVILIESDVRRPMIANTLGIESEHALIGVLLNEYTLEEALVGVPSFGPNLKVLPAGNPGAGIDWLFSLPTAKTLIDDAKAMADYVVVDSPPLAEVLDSLPMAKQADEVLLVTRIGRTRLAKLQHLGEILAQHKIRPVGFAVVGVGRASQVGYYTGKPSKDRDIKVIVEGTKSPKGRTGA